MSISSDPSGTDPNSIPTRAELISQAVNGDMVRILTTTPPRPLVIARRFEIARRACAVLAALAFGAASVSAIFAPFDGTALLLVTAVGTGLLYVALWAATIRYAHLARVQLLHTYGVAPDSNGVFELLRAAEPHDDLAATREALRVYALADRSGAAIGV